jgi:CIC family chloride channel protein
MILWLLAVLIGVLAGVLTPAAWWVVQRCYAGLTGGTALGAMSPGYTIGVPFGVAGALFLLFLGSRAFRSADGFTYFISDLHFQDGRRKVRYSFVHGAAQVLMLVGKGVVGIEGFCMEVLSAIGSWLGQRFSLSANQTRSLAACGATAAIAAVLGQPTAAFLFIVELLYGWGSVSFSVGIYAVAAFVAASLSQSLTSPTGIFNSVFGSDAGLASAIRTENFELSPQTALFCVILVSFLAGIIAAFSIWVHQKTDQELHRLFDPKKSSDMSPPALALRLGLWAAITAVALNQAPQVVGAGTDLLHDSLSQGYLLWMAALALLLRILLGAISYSVIGSMGLILPALVAGGLLGSCVAQLARHILPASSGAIALLSMGAYFSAAFGTPVAATALVFGYASGLMTDYALFLFTALLTNFSAHYLCGRLAGDRLPSMGLYRHGIRFRAGMCYNTLSGIQVKDAMVTYVDPIPRSSTIGEAYRRLMESKFSTLPVVNTEGRMDGLVSLSDFYGMEAWKRLGKESQVQSLVGVEEMTKPARVKLHPDMNLEAALVAMSDEDYAPVVEQEKYVGILVKSDLVSLYNKEVVKKAFRKD